MIYADCLECKHFKECYPITNEDCIGMEDVLKHFNAITVRDVCVNNDKRGWEQKGL